MTSRKSRKSKKVPAALKRKSLPAARKVAPPKTFDLNKKSKSRKSSYRVNSQMSLVELQFIARSKGIPFGGLTRTALARKINNY